MTHLNLNAKDRIRRKNSYDVPRRLSTEELDEEFLQLSSAPNFFQKQGSREIYQKIRVVPFFSVPSKSGLSCLRTISLKQGVEAVNFQLSKEDFWPTIMTSLEPEKDEEKPNLAEKKGLFRKLLKRMPVFSREVEEKVEEKFYLAEERVEEEWNLLSRKKLYKEALLGEAEEFTKIEHEGDVETI